MILDPDKKKEFDKIPDVDENGDPIFKIEGDSAPTVELEETAATAEDSGFLHTPQDLKDETSQD